MRWVLAASGGLAAMACYPDAIESFSDSEVVLTRRDPDTFGDDAPNPGYRTYARPDIVVPLRPDLDGPPVVPEPPELNDEILAAVDRNLEALGYRRLTDDAADADVVVLVGTTAEPWRAWGCYPGWVHWGWWPGWESEVGPDTIWCFPGSNSVISLPVGTLLIDMADADRLDPDADEIPVVWSAAINGLVDRSDAGVRIQIDRTIDRAFAQSNYLRDRSAP